MTLTKVTETTPHHQGQAYHWQIFAQN